MSLSILFFLLGWLHVFLAPYTKVEESFNLHAAHDFIFHGLSPSSLPNYDHFEFPGVVPRSCIGSGAVSVAAGAIAYLAKELGILHSKHDVQKIVRLMLATVNALGLARLQRLVNERFSRRVSVIFTLLTCSQFHIPFWMGRTLPNMFALYTVNIAFGFIIMKRATPEEKRRNYNNAITILTFSTVALRSELVLLLVPIVLQAIYLRHTDIGSVIKTGLIAGVTSLGLTVLIDSYFWNKWPLWPELAGLYFNVYQGKSSEWGVSPPYTYFLAHLPKLLMSALPLSVIGLIVDPRMRTLLFPCLAFVALLSCLGHKEWRFVVYVVPFWNIVGARGAAWLLSTRVQSRSMLISHGPKFVLLGFLGFNVVVTALLTRASMLNYPGGEALTRLNNILIYPEFRQGDNLSIHIDNYAAQTGASLFLHEYAPPYGFLDSSRQSLSVVYNKTENLAAPEDFNNFDWIISEYVGMFVTEDSHKSRWFIEDSINGLRGVELKPVGETGLWKILRVPRIIQEPKLWLLRREYGR